MFEWLASPEAWVSLATLISLEVVLGVDNIIFISILVARLPPQQRDRARQIGLMLAMLARLALLFSIVWIMGLVEPWFSLFGEDFSGRDLILLGGGLFLLAKATHEVHMSLEDSYQHAEGGEAAAAVHSSFAMVITQIALLDIVFSLDSVITAVGLVDEVAIMVIAILVAMVIMLLAAKPIGEFVDSHPTVKILALAFLILIGVTLVAEGLGHHIPKGYIYFAMAFSFGVEMINIRIRKNKAAAMMKLNKKIP